MIHWTNIFFLIMVIVTCLVVMGKQYWEKPKSKNFVLLFDLFIYFVFGLSFGFLIFQNISTTWWSILCILFCGLIIAFILLAVLNQEKKPYEGIKYTPNDLIGKKGVIVGRYSDEKWLGELFDEEHTGIVVKINELVEIYDTFKITKVDNGDIYAENIMANN